LKNPAEKPPLSNSKASCPRDLIALKRERTPGAVAIGAHGSLKRSTVNTIRSLGEVALHPSVGRSQLDFSRQLVEALDPERGHDPGAKAREACCSTTLINGHHRKYTKEAICL
jgi:hypothetical protein